MLTFNPLLFLCLGLCLFSFLLVPLLCLSVQLSSHLCSLRDGESEGETERVVVEEGKTVEEEVGEVGEGEEEVEGVGIEEEEASSTNFLCFLLLLSVSFPLSLL